MWQAYGKTDRIKQDHNQEKIYMCKVISVFACQSVNILESVISPHNTSTNSNHLLLQCCMIIKNIICHVLSRSTCNTMVYYVRPTV